MGRLLVETVLRAEATTWWLLTNDIDSPAMRLYERLGFVRAGFGPDASSGRPAVLMMRFVDDPSGPRR